MKIKKDFGSINKDRIIFYTLALVIAVIALGNFIATSFGTFDDDMSSIFNKAMDTDFWRAWAAFIINDGYIAIVVYIVPTVPLIYEALVIYSKKNKPNWWFAQHSKSSYWTVFGVFTFLFEIIILAVYYQFNWADEGFGAGYNIEFIIGPKYQIPMWVASEVIANGIYFGLFYWFHYKLAKRPDFLQLKIWRPVFMWYIFLITDYIVDLGLKWGMWRPYWYQIHMLDGYDGPQTAYAGQLQIPVLPWDEDLIHKATVSGYHVTGTLQRFKDIYPEQYDYFMRNDIWDMWIGGSVKDKGTTWRVLSTWGGHENWYWYLPGDRTKMGGALAFPSGHMVATVATAAFPMLIMFNYPNKSKKEKSVEYGLTILGIVYVFYMLFALQISSSHWWSDSTFSLAFNPVFYAIGWLASNAIFDKFNKHFNVDNY